MVSGGVLAGILLGQQSESMVEELSIVRWAAEPRKIRAPAEVGRGAFCAGGPVKIAFERGKSGQIPIYGEN